ncbi:MAG TPA: class I tRNA ligase family protein, partial [Candidatus Odoribacter faecigallinarum]|nr:class I tRNA ligase family protein [Candidatus Odoribacter faecigallinarum]
RLGNAIDPFETIEKYGSDPLRWYMITNSQPWDNLKFDLAGVDEVKRKFFGTLYNTYGFFALYANVDHFRYAEADIPMAERPELDRWILSLLNTLIKEVTEAYEKYEPTRAGRAIQDFVIENLSNWYVRLSRKRYWGGEYSQDKISAYQTLYTCLETVAILASPIAPFYMDKLFCDLNSITGHHAGSVHLTDFPKANERVIDTQLEERMTMAQQISSMVLGLRRKVQLRVRQPLSKLMIPILHEEIIPQLDAVKNIILSEVNVKEIEYITDTTGILVKRIKPNFKTLGPKYGKYMKQISAQIAKMEQSDIFNFEKNGSYDLNIEGNLLTLGLEDVEILSEDIPGWLVANEGRLTVALDINVTKELKEEGIARELINRIQNLRKESDFDVTDKISLIIGRHPEINEAVEHFSAYIAGQVLAEKIELSENREDNAKDIEIDDIKTFIKIEKYKA